MKTVVYALVFLAAVFGFEGSFAANSNAKIPSPITYDFIDLHKNDFTQDNWTWRSFLDAHLLPTEIEGFKKAAKAASFIGMFIPDQTCASKFINFVDTIGKFTTKEKFDAVFTEACKIDKQCIGSTAKSLAQRVAETSSKNGKIDAFITIAGVEMSIEGLIEDLPLVIDYLCSAHAVAWEGAVKPSI